MNAQVIQPPTAPRTKKRRLLAWQGLEIEIPVHWDPVRIDGNFDRGFILLADLRRPKMGLRWETVSKTIDPTRAVETAMRSESDGEDIDRSIDLPEWSAAAIRIDSDFPGRDIFIALSQSSNRLLQLTYHASRPSRALIDVLLPTLKDSLGSAGWQLQLASRTTRQRWNIFDLQCEVPHRFKLQSHELLAGELKLAFTASREILTVRQIAFAQLALQNRSIDQWVQSQQRKNAKHYRTSSHPVIHQPEMRSMRRRRRFIFMRSWPRELFTVAFHDELNDRLLIVEASSESLARETLSTMMSAEDR